MLLTPILFFSGLRPVSAGSILPVASHHTPWVK